MRKLRSTSGQKDMSEAARLVRMVEGREGEDNVFPWLRAHTYAAEAALRGYRIGLQAAKARASLCRN